MKKIMLTVAVIATLMFSCAKQKTEPTPKTIEEINTQYANHFGKVKLYTSDKNDGVLWVNSESLDGKGNWVSYQDQVPQCDGEPYAMTLTLKVGVPNTFTVYTYVDPTTKNEVKDSWVKTVTISYEGECRTFDVRK